MTLHNRPTKFGILVFLLFFCFPALHAAKTKYPDPVAKNLELARYYLYINEDSSLLYNNYVYDWAVKNKRRVLESEVLLLKAETLLYKGDIDNVLEICRTVRETAQNTGNRSLLVSVLLLQARCYTEMNIFDKAYQDLSSAQEIANQINDSTALANVFNAFGVLYDLQKESKQALVWYEKGLAYTDQRQEALLHIRLLNNKAIVFTAEGRLDEAKDLLNYCIEYVQNHRIAFGMDRLYMNLAPIYISEGKTDSAMIAIQRSLEIAEQHDNRSSIARSLIYKGYILFTLNDITGSRTAFEKADSIAVQLGADNMHSMILQYFAWIAETEQDYRQAYYYLQQFKQTSDSLANKRNVINLIRLRMENEAAQAELANRYRMYRLIMATVLLVLLLILAGTVFLYRYKRSRRLLQNKQAENAHLASELEQENKRMVTQSIYRQKQANDLQEIAEQLQRSRTLFKPSNQSLVDRTISLLKNHSLNDHWEDFETRFERVHTGFLKNLQQRHPQLSPNERKLCAYLRLDMTSKEIATILHVSPRAIEQARYRLRKKLSLKKSEDLNLYLSRFD